MKLVKILLFTFLSTTLASASAVKNKSVQWPFNGVFGYFDKQAIQRGFQVYREVCQTCHSMRYLTYRNLGDVGFSPDEIKEIAGSYNVIDGPNDKGEMYQRPGRPYDFFVSPYPNEEAARAVNGGAYPPDLSLIIKARHDGANYVYSLLTGYTSPPADFKLGENMHYNPYFPNSEIVMPEPLSAGQVTYSDGTEASIDQMSKDVVIFLQWAAEPEMAKRKLMGVKVILYLVVFTVLFYFAKKRVWKDVK